MTAALHKQPERFAEAVIDGETVLMDMDNGSFLGLEETATTIWTLIDGTRNRAAIADLLCATFDGPPETIDRDLDTFLERLREAGFVA